jgi:hypothetical protein
MRSKALRLAVAAGVLAIASGCDQGLTDLNRNPNNPDRATPEYLFANATEAAVSRVFGTGLNMDIAGLWAQYYAEHRFSEEDRYLIADNLVNGHWVGFYAGPLQDLQETIELSTAAGRASAAAQGRILKDWTFSVVTDAWGDVGYSEALQGRNPAAGNTPALDPQAAIYDALLADLTDAQAHLTGGGQPMTTADLLYGGNTEQWKRFANSLRLRLAMRLSKAAPDKAKAAFSAALADGAFASNADNAVLRYIDNGINQNPLYGYERQRDDHSVSATMIDTLKSFSDPRLAIYAKPTAAGTYVGMKNGSLTQPALTAVSKIGAFYSSANSPAFVMTYAEVLFLQAEAAERGWTTGNAAALYTAGIRASMQMVGVTGAAIDAYLAQPRVQYQGGAAGLTQIRLQKWIALYGNGVEAWAEWRRTGQPALTAGPDAQNGGRIPVRLPYPQNEVQLNRANFEAAIARQGGATLNDPVWWAK